TPAIPSDVPSDANKASLDATLKWLGTALEHNTPPKGPFVPRKFEASEFRSCKIRYTLVPIRRTSPVSDQLVYAINQYELYLAELNPEAVSVSQLSDYAAILLATRNSEARIRITMRWNDNGMAGRTMDERSVASTSIDLRNANAAAQIKVAIVHAIGLCRQSPLRIGYQEI